MKAIATSVGIRDILYCDNCKVMYITILKRYTFQSVATTTRKTVRYFNSQPSSVKQQSDVKRSYVHHVIVLYCIVLYCIVLYCIVLHCIVLYCITLHCIVLYCIVLYCIVLH